MSSSESQEQIMHSHVTKRFNKVSVCHSRPRFMSLSLRSNRCAANMPIKLTIISYRTIKVEALDKSEQQCKMGNESAGQRRAAGYLQDFIPKCAKKRAISHRSYSGSLSAAQSLEGMSANLIPASIQLKRVQRHMALGRLI